FGSNISHERQYVPDTTPLFSPDQYCSLEELRSAMSRVISELPIKEEKPRVQVKKVVSLEEMIDRLHQRIEKQLKLRFSELVAGEGEKHGLIVGFLAVLESVKQG